MRKATLVLLYVVFASLIGVGIYLYSIDHPTQEIVRIITVTNESSNSIFGIHVFEPSTYYVEVPPPWYASLWPIFLGAGIIGMLGLTFRAVKRK